jgi:hypothetical protein
MQRVPHTFRAFSEAFLGLREQDMQRLWTVLYASTWSEHVAIRQSFLFYDSVEQDIDYEGLMRTSSPRALVKMLEELVRLGKLSRRHATSVEERILHYTNKNWY